MDVLHENSDGRTRPPDDHTNTRATAANTAQQELWVLQNNSNDQTVNANINCVNDSYFSETDCSVLSDFSHGNNFLHTIKVGTARIL